MNNNIVVVFEEAADNDPVMMNSLAFGMWEAFAVRFQASCAIERVGFPKPTSDFVKNIERVVERAKLRVRENHPKERCLYLAASSLPLAEGTETFTFPFALPLAFFDGRLVGKRFEGISENVPQAFVQRVAFISARVAMIQPVVNSSVAESDEAGKLIDIALEGLGISINLYRGNLGAKLKH
jgi:hypothetical protein